MLTFPASILGAHLSAAEWTVDGVVPAPVSDFTPAKPGEAALRLAVRAASVSRRPLYPILRKSSDGFVATSSGEGRSVILLEDQVTSGRTVAESVRVLEGAGWSVRAILAWSASDNSLAAAIGAVDRAGVMSAPCPYESNLKLAVGVGDCPVHGER